MKNQISLSLFSLFFLFLQPAFSQQEADSVRNFHIGFIYPMSSNGVKAADYTNRFSLHAIAGISKNETGVSIAGVANVIKQDASGAQISGVVNYIGKDAKGAQIAGLGNLIAHSSEGIQIAGLFNRGTRTQSQIAGFINTANQLKGAQIAGFANITAQETEGIQIAGFINRSREVNTQIAGFINVAQKVKGAQIAGFINIAEASDYPIGFVNIIKNGEKSIGISIDETQTTLAVLRSGGRVLYGILGVGYHLENKSSDFYALEAGLGANLPITSQFRIRGEVAGQTLVNFKGSSYQKGVVRILPSLKLGNRLEVYGGPTLNRVFYDSDHEFDYFDKKTIWQKYSNEHWNSIHVGYTAGVQIHF